MVKSFIVLTIKLMPLFVFVACQSSQLSDNKKAIASLSSDNGTLDLAQSTFEQQKIDKEKAAKNLLEAREKRVVINPDDLVEVEIFPDVNIAIYARTTKNVFGKKSYLRLNKKEKGVNPCVRFNVADDAQRYFLQKGGPEKDLFGLDLDGDGFACDWNPEPFRKIKIQ